MPSSSVYRIKVTSRPSKSLNQFAKSSLYTYENFGLKWLMILPLYAKFTLAIFSSDDHASPMSSTFICFPWRFFEIFSILSISLPFASATLDCFETYPLLAYVPTFKKSIAAINTITTIHFNALFIFSSYI